MKKWIFVVTIVLLSASASAQVHKCEGPDGPVYQQQPCSGEGEAVRGISVTPGASPEQQQAMERERHARQQAASDRRQQRITDTHNEVRRIQKENYDPDKCAKARNRLFMMRERGEPDYSTDLFIARERVKLYCRP